MTKRSASAELKKILLLANIWLYSATFFLQGKATCNESK